MKLVFIFFIQYPSYNGKSTRWMHDIALLQLSESLILNPFIRSICLSSNKDFVKLGDRTLVTGWGETHGSGNFRFLREVEVPIQPNDQCGLKGLNLATTLCAGLCQNSTCDACQVNFLTNKTTKTVGLFLCCLRVIQVVQWFYFIMVVGI